MSAAPITTNELITALEGRTEAHIVAPPGIGVITTIERHYGAENVLDLSFAIGVEDLSDVAIAIEKIPDTTVIILSALTIQMSQGLGKIRELAPDALLIGLSTELGEPDELLSPTQRITEQDPIIVEPSDFVVATFRLAAMRQSYPELSRAEARAKRRLADAIMAMDAAENQPGRHNLQEQAAVERAKDAYARALADLVRGETNSCE